MKSLILVSCFGLVCALAPALRASDWAPASVNGLTAVIVVESGSGYFASAGSYFLTPNASTYAITWISPNYNAEAGTYIWTKTSATTATITVTDSATGYAAIEYINFSSAAGGTFSTSEWFGAQSGVFLWAGAPTLNKFVNISTRGMVQTGSGVLIAGFVISGTQSKTVLIRGVGPGLIPYGVATADALADPQLTLFDSNSNQIGSNDNWGGTSALSTAFTQVGAFALSAASKDAAMLVTLQPGIYTAQVSGVGGTTGIALVEVYEMP